MWLLPRARGQSGAPPKPPVHRQNQALKEHKEQSKVEYRNRQARQKEGALSLTSCSPEHPPCQDTGCQTLASTPLPLAREREVCVHQCME